MWAPPDMAVGRGGNNDSCFPQKLCMGKPSASEPKKVYCRGSSLSDSLPSLDYIFSSIGKISEKKLTIDTIHIY